MITASLIGVKSAVSQIESISERTKGVLGNVVFLKHSIILSTSTEQSPDEKFCAAIARICPFVNEQIWAVSHSQEGAIFSSLKYFAVMFSFFEKMNLFFGKSLMNWLILLS